MFPSEKYDSFLLRLKGARPKPVFTKQILKSSLYLATYSPVEAATHIRIYHSLTGAVAFAGEQGGCYHSEDKTIFYYSDKLMVAWWCSLEHLLVIFPEPGKPKCQKCGLTIKPPNPNYFTRTKEASYDEWMNLAQQTRQIYGDEYRNELRVRRGFCVYCDTDDNFYGSRIPR